MLKALDGVGLMDNSSELDRETTVGDFGVGDFRVGDFPPAGMGDLLGGV